jgi:hypothetical protein
MNPLPLSAPDGRIYAYACGVCHQVQASSCRLCRLEGPDAILVATSLEHAEGCCRCSERQCRAPLEAPKCRYDRCDRCEQLAGIGALIWAMAHMGCGVCEWCGGDRGECYCEMENCTLCERPRNRCECPPDALAQALERAWHKRTKVP